MAGLRGLPAGAARALELNAPGAPRPGPALRQLAGLHVRRPRRDYPAALEGALKLKEISYVHAEGYPAGELKHGPISLLDAECPLVAVATRSPTYEKLISNVMEGRPRRPGDRRRDRGRRGDRGASPTTSPGCPTRTRS